MAEPHTVVRPMRGRELAATRALAVSAFGGDEHIGELLDALRASWAWDDELSFVADRGGKLVGQVLYTHALLDAPRRLIDVLVLSPIGARPDLQRSGIGAELLARSLEAIVDRGDAPLVFLEGDPGYYSRFGFELAFDHGFRPPSRRIPPPSFQVRRLPSHEEWMTGTLVYPDAFWRTDSVGLRFEP